MGRLFFIAFATLVLIVGCTAKAEPTQPGRNTPIATSMTFIKAYMPSNLFGATKQQASILTFGIPS